MTTTSTPILHVHLTCTMDSHATNIFQTTISGSIEQFNKGQQMKYVLPLDEMEGKHSLPEEDFSRYNTLFLRGPEYRVYEFKTKKSTPADAYAEVGEIAGFFVASAGFVIRGGGVYFPAATRVGGEFLTKEHATLSALLWLRKEALAVKAPKEYLNHLESRIVEVTTVIDSWPEQQRWNRMINFELDGSRKEGEWIVMESRPTPMTPAQASDELLATIEEYDQLINPDRLSEVVAEMATDVSLDDVIPFDDMPARTEKYEEVDYRQWEEVFQFDEGKVLFDVKVGRQGQMWVAGYLYSIRGAGTEYDYQMRPVSRQWGEFASPEQAELSVLLSLDRKLELEQERNKGGKKRVGGARQYIADRIAALRAGAKTPISATDSTPPATDSAESPPEAATPAPEPTKEERRAEAEEFMASIPSRERKRAGSEIRTLFADLSEERKIELGNALSEACLEREEVTEEKKAVMSDFTAKLKLIDVRIDKMARCLTDGKEEASVSCEWWRDYGTGMKELIRADTGEVLESKPLASWEYQEELPLAEEEEEESDEDPVAAADQEETTAPADDPTHFHQVLIDETLARISDGRAVEALSMNGSEPAHVLIDLIDEMQEKGYPVLSIAQRIAERMQENEWENTFMEEEEALKEALSGEGVNHLYTAYEWIALFKADSAENAETPSDPDESDGMWIRAHRSRIIHFFKSSKTALCNYNLKPSSDVPIHPGPDVSLDGKCKTCVDIYTKGNAKEADNQPESPKVTEEMLDRVAEKEPKKKANRTNRRKGSEVTA